MPGLAGHFASWRRRQSRRQTYLWGSESTASSCCKKSSDDRERRRAAADYRQITGEEPELVSAEEVGRIFERIRTVDPEVKRALKESVGSEG
jgi:hypothetical protein